MWSTAARKVLSSLCRAYVVPDRFRVALLRATGARVGGGVRMLAGLTVVRPELLSIDDGCFVSLNCYLDGSGGLMLGENVSLANNVQILTTTHRTGPSTNRAGERLFGPVRVGGGTWVGAGVIILPGVRIGGGCVIGAGSVVTSDCSPDGLYTGVPARRVRELHDADETVRGGTEPVGRRGTGSVS
jgi:maltose O-acetyltransferase